MKPKTQEVERLPSLVPTSRGVRYILRWSFQDKLRDWMGNKSQKGCRGSNEGETVGVLAQGFLGLLGHEWRWKLTLKAYY